FFFFFSSRRRHTRFDCDWSSDVCSSDLRSRSGWVSSLPAKPTLFQASIENSEPTMAAPTAPSPTATPPVAQKLPPKFAATASGRSEERRVGKECGWRWVPCQQNETTESR